mmetsp:Transcript_96012/g.275660  ORF Transcript_96012/g.275660 Transcript_96012/m.275660 type:complete len:250 (-) Transcript_96012:194-943(-)
MWRRTRPAAAHKETINLTRPRAPLASRSWLAHFGQASVGPAATESSHVADLASAAANCAPTNTQESPRVQERPPRVSMPEKSSLPPEDQSLPKTRHELVTELEASPPVVEHALELRPLRSWNSWHRIVAAPPKSLLFLSSDECVERSGMPALPSSSSGISGMEFKLVLLLRCLGLRTVVMFSTDTTTTLVDLGSVDTEDSGTWTTNLALYLVLSVPSMTIFWCSAALREGFHPLEVMSSRRRSNQMQNF